MEFKTISFDIWEANLKRYIKNYILTHNIYRHIPSDIDWDASGTVEKIDGDLLLYVSNLEKSVYDDDFLSLLYNGDTRESYVSGCGFFHDTFHSAIIEEAEMDLFSKMCDINDIRNDEDDRYDELYDFVADMHQKWIYDIVESFEKEKVIRILKSKKLKNMRNFK